MSILKTNENYLGNKSLVYTAYSAAYDLGKVRRFWELAQAQATPQGWSTASNLAVRTLIDTTLSRVTPFDLMEYYDLLEDSETGWSNFGVSAVNDVNVGEPLSAQYKTELLMLLGGTALAFLAELNSEVSALLV